MQSSEIEKCERCAAGSDDAQLCNIADYDDTALVSQYKILCGQCLKDLGY